MNELTARTLITISVWFGVTIILTFGLFKMNFQDVFSLILISCLVLSAAVGTTAIVWLYKPPEN